MTMIEVTAEGQWLVIEEAMSEDEALAYYEAYWSEIETLQGV